MSMENLILLIIMAAFGTLIYFGVKQTKATRQKMMEELDALEDVINDNLPIAPVEPKPTVSAEQAQKTEEPVKEAVKSEPTVSAEAAAKTEGAKPKKYYKKKGRPAKPKN